MVHGRNRAGGCPVCIEIIVRNRVNDGISLQQRPDHAAQSAVALHVRSLGLIRNMEIAPLVRPVLFVPEIAEHLRNQGVQKVPVFFAVRGSLPSKQPLFFPIHRCHHLGASRGTPLGKEMVDLQIPDSHPVAQIHPSSQSGKVKEVLSFFYLYIYQLGGWPFSANVGIQGGRQHRRQDHVHAVTTGIIHEVFNDLPVPFRKCFRFIVLQQAVRIKPLGKDQFLGRQQGIDDLKVEGRFRHSCAGRIGEQASDRIDSRRKPLLWLHLHPKRIQHIGSGQPVPFPHGFQQIRVQSRLRAQIIIIVVLTVHRHHGGNAFDLVNPDRILQGRFHGKIHDPFGIHYFCTVIAHLKAEPFVFQHGCVFQRFLLCHVFIRKALFQRG